MNAIRIHTNQVEFLKFLQEPLRTEISRRMRLLRALAGQTILQKGTRSEEVYFILEGEAEVVLYEASGDSVFVNIIGAGDVVGELAALDGKSRSASVVACSDLSYAVMAVRDFKACIEGSAPAAIWLAHKLASGMRRLTEKLFELSALTIPLRVCREVLRLAEKGSLRNGVIEVPDLPTQEILASRANMDRPSLTRQLRILKKENIIDYGGDDHVLKVLDLPRLQREARL